MHKEIAHFRLLTMLLLVVAIVGCNAEVSSSADDPDAFEGTGAGLVYLTNPIVNGESTPDYQNNTFSRKITDNVSLIENCSFKVISSNTTSTTLLPCFQVRNTDDSTSTPLVSSNGGWTYTFGSDSFYQVSTFYHVKTMMNQVLESLSFAQNISYLNRIFTLPSSTNFFLPETQAFWLTQNTITQTLNVLSKCYLADDEINAFYSPAESKICLGYNSNFNFRFAQDPSIIYHELGHTFVDILLNQRNTYLDTNNIPVAIPYKVNLGKFSYDEGGAINEGIADFFSYYMNKRSKLGEWALGKGFNAARPVTESDSLHHATFTTTEKLSYPRYLHYDSNVPFGQTNSAKETKHNAGQITSHYLVALHKTIQNTCSFPTNTSGLSTANYKHKMANNYLVYLLSETLGELGDQTSKGSDFFRNQDVAFENLNPENAYEWNESVDTITYRKFYKTIAKNIYHSLSMYMCPSFTKDESESLLDQYGLLLFKNYTDEGSGLNTADNSPVIYRDIASVHPDGLTSATTDFNATSTIVDEINRNNSILISKDLISLPSTGSGLSTAYLIDKRSDIENILTDLTFKGISVTTSTGLAGVEYNNNNIQIGPGEIVGVSLNIINNSNSSMAGLEILGNDWDHMKLVDSTKRYVNRHSNENNATNSADLAEFKPCQFNGFPLISEGALTDTTELDGDCSNNSKDNKKIDLDGSGYPMHALDSPQPICLVKHQFENEDRWVSQNYKRKTMNLLDSNCLNNANSGDSFNPNSCLVRILPGASNAVYSKLDSGKTLAGTLTQDGSSFELKSSNIVLFEINKETPPGTQFSCRFRARMSNCSDCFSDSNGDEYSASDYTSNKPFKVINFSFTVTE